MAKRTPSDMFEEILEAGLMRSGPNIGTPSSEHWHRFLADDRPLLQRALNVFDWLKSDANARAAFLNWERGEK